MSNFHLYLSAVSASAEQMYTCYNTYRFTSRYPSFSGYRSPVRQSPADLWSSGPFWAIEHRVTACHHQKALQDPRHNVQTGLDVSEHP